ncbi:3-hydroxyacyl-CoA dehydrogenase NAD-binding domain-containing protein [Teichococcus aestuarii]|uniref:3-hydroxyacyl-CoA dehydrogenase NAD-binding domain-containing protein n=1 Tax=Teichococcus aestuarii TaxID=568898 RepID=UPI00360DF5E2
MTMHPSKVAIVGAGLIGRAWAMIFARAGWQVALFDPAPGIAAQAEGLCAQGLTDLAEQGLCEDPAGAARRIQAVGSRPKRCRTPRWCRRTALSGWR